MNDVLGDSRSDRAAAGEHEEEAAELFPTGSLEGEGPSPQTLVKKGLPLELTVSLSRAEVPLRGGLLDPNRYGRLLVTYLPGKVEEVPVRDDENDPARVTGWKLRQHVRATYVEAAADVPALIRAQFEQLAQAEPAAAGRLLDQLRELAAAGLREAA